MTRTRLFLAQDPKKTQSPQDWDQLARQALQMADLNQDPRAQAIRTAIQQGRTVEMLKRLGIIGDQDIRREFPIHET